MRTYSILLGLALAPAMAWPADACELPVCTAPQHQGYPLIATDGAGGALIAWLDFRNGADYDIYAQRVQQSPGGLTVVPAWPADGAAVTLAPGDQNPQALVPDGAGGVIVLWTDNRHYSASGYDIHAQRVTADGTLAPGWPAEGLPVCTAAADQVGPRATSDGAGGAIVVWVDYRAGGAPGEPGSNPDLYAIRVRPDGSLAPGWAPNGNPVCTHAAEQLSPVLVADEAGGAIVVWGDTRDLASNGADVYAQRLTPTGGIAAGWPEQGALLSAAPGHQGAYKRIVPDGVGGAIAAWADYRNDPSEYPYPDLYAQRVLADGTLAPGWPVDGLAVAVAPDIQWNSDMASDGTGGAFLVWEDYRNYNPSAADLFGQRITGSGTVAPGWPPNGLLVATGPGWQLAPRVVPDGRGGILIAFESYPGGDYDLYAQRVLGDGTIAPGWPAEGRALCTGTVADDSRPAAVSDGRNGMIVASQHVTVTAADIFANWVPGDDPTPTLVALASAEAEPDRVVLAWYGAEAAGLAATVERRTEVTDWNPLATLIADGTGTFRYQDRAVAPATRYGYRLRYRARAEVQLTEPHWVAVPAPMFALHGPRPNPAAEDLVVAFSLSGAEPARLELYDLGGRLLMRREVGTLGPGTHRVDLTRGAHLPAGVYTLRLWQGERWAATRAAVIR